MADYRRHLQRRQHMESLLQDAYWHNWFYKKKEAFACANIVACYASNPDNFGVVPTKEPEEAKEE